MNERSKSPLEFANASGTRNPRDALRFAIAYALAGALWIFLSGELLTKAFEDPVAAAKVESIKGLLFVAVTAVLLWLTLNRHFAQLRRSTEALRESERRLRGIGDNIPDGYVFQAILEPDGKRHFSYVSAGVTRVHGITVDQALAEPSKILQSITPDQRAAYAQAEATSARDLSDFAMEMSLQHPERGEIWIAVMSRPRRSSTGQVIWEGVVTDITQRRRLDVDRRRWAKAFEHCAHGIGLSDPTNDEVILCNPALARMLGRTVEELSGIPVFSLYAAADHDRIREHSAEADREGCVRYEANMRRSDGTEFPVQMDVVSVRDDTGTILYRVATAQDISADKAALHEMRQRLTLQDQLRQLSRAVEQSPVNIVITDTNGTIEYVNPSFLRTTGYALEEVIGRNPRILKSGESDPELYRKLWASITAGREWQGELHNRRKNGDLFWEWATISPITDTSGRITHFLAVKEDITKRKELEAQLRQSQKLEGVGQLAGGIAHDFNNILGAILMNIGLMRSGSYSVEEVRTGLQELEEAAKRAVNLTRQLLMFSRRSVLSMAPININESVASLLKMLARLIGEHIELRSEGFGALPTIEADAGMIDQVLLNLVVNARDAMPSGGTIKISTSVVEVTPADVSRNPERYPGRFVCISVSDTGCGIDPASKERIFEPFFTTKEPGKGTGLGLATVHGIVKQHKGWIELESELGRGSTFRIFFPALSRTLEPTVGTTFDEPTPGGNEGVLVVEDDSTLRSLVVRSLISLGYRVFEAEDGSQALRLWDEHPGEIDLLVTDMVMPHGISGIDLAKHLQSTKPMLRVILTSGYNDELARSGVPKHAGLVYLTKPYEPQTLARIARKLLDQIKTER